MEEQNEQKIIMIPLAAVSRFRWDEECGQRLETYRAKIGRQEFANAIAKKLELPEGKLSGRLKADSCSARYIQKLEKAEMVSIPAEVAVAISIVLAIDIEDLLQIPSAHINLK